MLLPFWTRWSCSKNIGSINVYALHSILLCTEFMAPVLPSYVAGVPVNVLEISIYTFLYIKDYIRGTRANSICQSLFLWQIRIGLYILGGNKYFHIQRWSIEVLNFSTRENSSQWNLYANSESNFWNKASLKIDEHTSMQSTYLSSTTLHLSRMPLPSCIDHWIQRPFLYWPLDTEQVLNSISSLPGTTILIKNSEHF